MEYLKKFLYRGLFGMLMGVFASNLLAFIMAFRGIEVTLSPELFIKQFIMSVTIGFYCIGISVIFDVEEWSLLRQTVTHSIAMLLYFPMALYAGWMPPTAFGKVVFIINYLLVYALAWFVFKQYWMKKTRELNAAFKERNGNHV